MFIVGLYRVGLGLADRVWFQNREDAVYFESLGICPKSKAIVIRSGGVDTEEYFPGCVHEKQLEILRREFGLSDQNQLVAMSARNNWRKGVREFIEASELCGKTIPHVRFLLMTLEEQNMDAIPVSYLKEKTSRTFQWLGRRHDVKEIFALSDVVVLPSYYGEGVPHSLLEAMALGKPIVTTDNVGCREVIEDGTNGFMIPPRDSAALAKAITAILADVEIRAKFGRNSRIKAVNEFSDHLVLRRVLSELYGLEDSCTQADTDGRTDQSSASKDDSMHQRERETL
jgi:N,N'-diacetylbacillosaminyl-diphospho-undecaprenol alpha-1,3-N-acetylgalactosaminyltransferase